MRPFAIAARGLTAAAVVALATLLLLAAGANPLTAGFIDLVLVLGLAVRQGFLAGAIASVLATACLNFFFFPPLHSFHLAEPQNWISLACFLIAATVASRLVVQARERAAEAESRSREIASLYGERERFLAEQARLEALQTSDSLKTALLRAVSHDLSTPLTAILLSLETLKREMAGNPAGSRTVALLVEETARLNRRIHNLLAMARLEAHDLSLRREPTTPADLFHAARENLRPIASARGLAAQVSPECPDLDVDPSLALEILVNLIENADRASIPGEPIELHAAPDPLRPDRVQVEVLDRGAGLGRGSGRPGGVGQSAAETESGGAGAARSQGRSLAGGQAPERGGSGAPAGDVGRRGLGLEIARSFAAAHGGSVLLIDRDGGGVAARIDLPAVSRAASGRAGGPPATSEARRRTPEGM
jgi:K+-sensing histidine kinase KdpD